MTGLLKALLLIAAIGVTFAAFAFLVLRWLALRLARRIAESAEQRLATRLQHGMSRSGLIPRGTTDEDLRAKYLNQIERLAWLTDRVVPLPVGGGIGLDAVLGLVPVVGDVVSLCISSTIVLRAVQLGASQELVSRLIAIQCTDLALGVVPIVGDLVDVAYQSNVRSAQLIRQSMIDTLTTR
jgi:hypothetical protein